MFQLGLAARSELPMVFHAEAQTVGAMRFAQKCREGGTEDQATNFALVEVLES